MSGADALTEFAVALRARDSLAAGRVEREARSTLLHFCTGYLGEVDAAEDAVQDVLARLVATEGEPSSPRAWLLRVARNVCLDRLRTRAARPDGARLATSFDVARETAGHATRMAGAEQQGEVGAALARLDADARELLRLRYAEELTRAEIAELLGVDETLVKSRLYEAVEKLRRDLGQPASAPAG